MESEHNLDALRTMLRVLRARIEALEGKALAGKIRGARLRMRIEDAKRQEAEILAKLSKSGVKL